jgi:hypothetical protein
MIYRSAAAGAMRRAIAGQRPSLLRIILKYYAANVTR